VKLPKLWRFKKRETPGWRRTLRWLIPLGKWMLGKRFTRRRALKAAKPQAFLSIPDSPLAREARAFTPSESALRPFLKKLRSKVARPMKVRSFSARAPKSSASLGVNSQKKSAPNVIAFFSAGLPVAGCVRWGS
jgi:hypothetical protein